jgi:hypothetical protein
VPPWEWARVVLQSARTLGQGYSGGVAARGEGDDTAYRVLTDGTLVWPGEEEVRDFVTNYFSVPALTEEWFGYLFAHCSCAVS